VIHVNMPFRSALLLCVTFTACSEGSPTGPDDGDITRPTVTAVTPAAGANGIAIGTTITVTFSEPIDPASLTAATFTVVGPAGPVTGAVAAAGAVATFTPEAPLTELSSGYTATVTTGVRDTAGNALAADHAWQFTTEMVSPLYWYRLSNQHLGDEMSLDTRNGPDNECYMGDTGAFQGQYWRFTVLQPGLYRMTNMFRGPTLSLEGGDGSAACGLDPTGPFTGQFWTITPVTGAPGYHHLRTQHLGTARSLDTAGGTDVPYMAVSGPFTGQLWRIRRIQLIQ
jgi:hypothetical protein